MHGRGVLLAVSVVLFFALTGCGLNGRAQQQLNDGYQRYAAGDNAGAIRQMDVFLRENPHAQRADEAYYVRGLARYNLRQYDAAKLDLEQTVSQATNPELRAKAALALGDLSYDTGDMTLAENMYRHAISSFKEQNELQAQGYYRLGKVLQRQGRWREADAQFHKAMYYFPSTEPGRRSARLINANAWTIQAGAYSRMPIAAATARRLSAQGLPARAVAVRQDQRIQYAVQIGRYGRFEEADAMLAKVRAAQSDAFVTPAR